MASPTRAPAVVQVSSAPSRALYEAVTHAAAFETRPPDGLIAHAAAEQVDGTVLIVDVWLSGEEMDAFERERLLPALGSVPGAFGAMAAPPVRHPAFHLIAR